MKIYATYRDFAVASRRDDAESNNAAHFFSSLVSTRIAYVLHRAKLSPNAVTALFLCVGVLSSVAYTNDYPIVCYAFWRLHLVLDMADGDIARATKLFSKSATGFDRSNHIVINTLIIFSMVGDVPNEFLLASLLISFYLSYFFSRNYLSGKQKTIQFPFWKNLIKNVLGLEGLVAIMVFSSVIEMDLNESYVAFFFTITFASIFGIKLYGFVKNEPIIELETGQ